MSQIIYFIENSGYYKYVIAAGEGDSDVFFPLGFKNHYIEKLFKLHLAWPINKRSDAPYVKIYIFYLQSHIICLIVITFLIT